MADNNGVGFALSIPQSLLDKMDKMDDKLASIAASSSKMAESFNKSMNSMSTSFTPVVNSIDGLNKTLQSLDFSKMVGGFSSASTSNSELNKELIKTASSAKDTTNSVVAMNNELARTKVKTKGSVSDELAVQKKLYAELSESIRKYNELKATKSDTYIQAQQNKADIEQMNVVRAKISVLEKEKSTIESNRVAFRQRIDDLNGTTLAQQRSSDSLRQMSDYYRALEKSSAQAAKSMQSVASINTQPNKTYYGALTSANNANSIEQATVATKNLEAARASLTFTDVRYTEKLNNLNLALDKMKSMSSGGIVDLNRELARTPNTIGEAERQIQRLKQGIKEVDLGQGLANTQSVDAAKKRIAELTQTIKELQAAPTKKLTLNDIANLPENTINQRIEKIKQLQAAQRNLDTTNAQGIAANNQLNESIRRLNLANSEAVRGSRQLQEEQRKLGDVSGQLQRKLALVFSVSQLQGYINNMITIRGEFELQQKALQAILQNKDEADRLFGQMTEMAVKSPFQLKQLVTYTKQLAAYRVESEKLYGTTKMLADVSAGLGVDMNRLILAFGQVKAANYLRGSELRQFSEAGINILGELATYFSEIENKAVSVGDVFTRVSKRMVSFQDVEKIFERLTSSGGIFYNMQEMQAETLRGQVSNLRDSMDIMFNEIGKANEGVLKDSVKAVKFLFQNWKTVFEVMKVGTPILIYFAYAMKATSASTLAFAASFGIVPKAGMATLTMTQMLQARFLSLSAAVKATAASIRSFAASNPLLAAFAAVSYAVYKVYSIQQEYNAEIAETSKRFDELRKVSQQISVEFYNAKDAKNLDEQRNKLGALIEMAERDYNMNIKVNLQEASEEDISKLFESTSEKILELNTYARLFATAMIDVRGSFFGLGDGLNENLTDVYDSGRSLLAFFEESNLRVIHTLQELGDKMTDTQKQALKLINRGRQSDVNSEGYETEAMYLNRLKEGYELVAAEAKAYSDAIASSKDASTIANLNNNLIKQKNILKELGLDFDKLNGKLKHYSKQTGVLADDLKELAKKINIPEWIPDEQKVVILKTAIDKQNLDDLRTSLLYEWAEQEYNIKFTFDKHKVEKELKGWRIGFKKFRDELQDDLSSTNFTLPDITADLTKPKIIDEIEARIKDVKAELADSGGVITTDKEREELNLYLKLLEKQAVYARGEREDKGKDSELQMWKNRIEILKRANSEYEKLRKKMSDTESYSKVQEIMMPEFKEAGIDADTLFGFDDANTIKNIEDLARRAGAKYAALFLKETSPLNIEIALETRDAELKQAQQEIENAFSGYELSMQLSKEGIDRSLISDLFGIDTFNLDELRNKLEPKLKELYEQGGLDQVAAAKKAEQKISELTIKETQSRIKDYAKHLKSSISERVKLEIKAQDDINKASNLKIEDGTSAFSSSQLDSIKENITKERDAALAALDWSDFKGSDLYIKMFENLESTSTKTLEFMRDKLINLRESLKELDPTQLKEINNQIDKINEQALTRNPFKGLTENLKEYIEFQGKRKDLEDKYIQAVETQAKQKRETENQELVVETLRQQYYAIRGNKDATEEEVSAAKDKLEVAESMLQVLLNQLKAQGLITEEQAKALSLGERASNDLGKRLSEISSYLNEFSSAITNISSDLESIFGSMSDSSKDAIDTISEVVGGLGDMGSGISKVMSGEVLSGSIQVLSGLAKTIGSIFSVGDKKAEREIQNQLESVERLQRAYEKLKESIDKAYSVDMYRASSERAQANIEAQISSYERMIAAESSKKKSDDDKITEWKNAIEDLRDQSKELIDEINETLGGIGDNVLSTTREFVDAWYDAFKETGNGLSGLEDNFNDLLLNIIKNQAAMKVAEKFLAPFYEQIDKSIEDYELDAAEAQALREEAERVLPQVSEALEGIFGAFGALETEKGTLSGLQQGIESITEVTAQALEALLNSMRYVAFDSNAVLKNLYNLFSSQDSNANPMLAELRLQTAQLTSLNRTLSSLVKAGHKDGGYGMRVFIN